MKKDLKTKLISRKIKKPNSFLMFLVMRLLGILNRKYKVDVDGVIKEIELGCDKCKK